MKTVNPKSGQTMVEMGLVLGLVTIGMAFALVALKPELVRSYFRSSITPGGHVDPSNNQLVVPDMED